MSLIRCFTLGIAGLVAFSFSTLSGFAAETQPARPKSSPFGVSGIPLDQPEQLKQTKNLGITQVFVEVDQAGAEGKKIEKFVAAAKEAGLQVYFGLAPDADLAENIAKRVGEDIGGLSIGPIDYANESEKKAALDAAYAARSQFGKIKTILEVNSLAIGEGLETDEQIEGLGGSPWFALAVPLMGDRATELKQLATLEEKSPIPVWSFRIGIKIDPARTDILAEADAMRGIVYRTVEALSCRLDKVFWAEFHNADNNGMGLFAFDGKKMRMPFPAYHYLISRVWPFEKVEVIESGPELFGYKFHQIDGQSTTVAWAAPGVPLGKTWNKHLPGEYRIHDINGSVINHPKAWPLNIEPLYYEENSSPKFPKAMWGGSVYRADQREFPYIRSTAPEVGTVEVKEGWDWSLPEGIEPEPESGFFNFSRNPDKDTRVVGWHPKWKDWHVGPGKYDFSSMREILAEAKKENFKVGIRLQSVVAATVPEWLIEKYNPPKALLSSGQRLTIVAPWDDNVRREFEEFIREFGRQGFQDDPAFAWASIHGIGLALGEEFDLPEVDIRNLEKVAGLTEEKFRAWVLGRLNVWADAFGPKVYKLAWVGGENFGAGVGGYNEVARDAITLCLERGIGGRGGFVEMYNYKVNERLWGSSRSEDGYIITDENRFKQNVVMLDENEEYMTVKRWRFGLLEEDPHRWRLSNLRALQMRCNYLNTNSFSMDIDRQLTEYVRREMGRNAENSPDVWCYLREAYIKTDTEEKSLPLKNFERWIIQRDLPGGMTKPADRLERTYVMSTDPTDIRHEFNARRTDRASGNNFIYFNVDDRFTAKSALVKVTYLDNAKGTWAVEYNSTDKPDAKTATVECTGDGQIKTATFNLPDVQFANKLEHGQDLRIVAGEGDVTVHMVRVIRGN